MAIPKEVRIREVGPREGVQTSEGSISTADKLKLIDLLSLTGVKDIEITSLVRADKVPQMADAEEIIARYQQHSGIRYTALYLNPKGFERAETLGRLQNTGWLNIAASETFLQKNNNIGIDQAVEKYPIWLELFRAHRKKLEGLMLSTAFVCAYEGTIAQEKVIELLRKILAVCTMHGQTLPEVCLADTVGRAHPEMVRALVREVRRAFPDLIISLHLHNTNHLGLANVYAGLLEGVSIFDGSVGGVGGCPFMKGAQGNVATEDIVYLCQELGVQTGISLDRYKEAARFASEIFRGTSSR